MSETSATHESTPATLRTVEVTLTAPGEFAARNARGGEIRFGSGGGDAFTPVELLLAAIAGCAAIDVEMITAKRAEPTELLAVATGDKVKEGALSVMRNLAVEFTAAFPAGEQGDAARAVLAEAIRMSQDRLCTVANTVGGGSPVVMHERGA